MPQLNGIHIKWNSWSCMRDVRALKSASANSLPRMAPLRERVLLLIEPWNCTHEIQIQKTTNNKWNHKIKRTCKLVFFLVCNWIVYYFACTYGFGFWHSRKWREIEKWILYGHRAGVVTYMHTEYTYTHKFSHVNRIRPKYIENNNNRTLL